MEVRVSRLLKKLTRFGLGGGLLYAFYWGGMEWVISQNRLAASQTNQDQKTLESAQRLDVGDLLFIKTSCRYLLSTGEIRRCYIEHFYKRLCFYMNAERRYRQGEWDSMATILPGQDGLQVVGFMHHSYKEYPISSFLSLPFIEMAGVRRLESKEPSLKFRSIHFEKSLQNLHSSIQESWTFSTPSIFRDDVDLILNFWSQVGLADQNALTSMLRITIEDLNVKKPKVLGIGVAGFSDLEVIKGESEGI